MTFAPCPLCGDADPQPFLLREAVPVYQNLVMGDQSAAEVVPRGDLDMRVCLRCGFVFNAAFDSKRLRYGQDYDNAQNASGCFREHVAAMIARVVAASGGQPTHVAEVGCGKGEFLTPLVAALPSGSRGEGFDPSYVGPAETLGGRLRFRQVFYGPDAAHVPADLVVSRHVIEHVASPMALLRAIRDSMPRAEDSRLFIETPCVKWILRNNIIWDFFYEHCSLFSSRSLAAALRASGFAVHRIEHVFGGQYLWAEASPCLQPSTPEWDAECVPLLAKQFSRAEQKLTQDWKERIQELAAKGPLAIWGAGAKGVTFANLVDDRRKLIDCVADLNPNKQGKYLPGSGHKIVNYFELKSRRIHTALLMNPNYREENERLLASAGLDVRLVE